ncbi:caspase family protein [Streptomyces sp. SL13]|uniref:Caspase family protein n=1 Tax=Streptantibioticus silvisoli TaxID=2705255 RepID=A0AA90K1D4_9ACTN|nr:caspase family protein [Streptantibioticus silvisoli]MDI5966461.1 caspase family protein [Streptantibioticus silvisoli]MDI5973766.1 caspase family protein [Streptantibioticus silvisoli]
MANRTLVIGVGDYGPGSELDSHPTITASALQYGAVLRQDSSLGPDGCRVLSGEEVATTNAVMDALEQAAAGTGPKDRLMVVYVGHGMHWKDLPTKEVHFAVGTSEASKPWKWLSSSYFYHVMRKAGAGLKVLIADCCYSDLLPALGGGVEDSAARLEVLGEPQSGTCVFAALKGGGSGHFAPADGCAALPPAFSACTPFSGHLLHLLQTGTTANVEHFTIGQLREAVKHSMKTCRTDHPMPKMVLNDANENIPIFPNRMEHGRRIEDVAPQGPAAWIDALKFGRATRLPELLRDEGMAGDVVALLRARRDPECSELARLVEAEASRTYRNSETFVRFLSRAAHRRGRPV